jgi:hypothetical protein
VVVHGYQPASLAAGVHLLLGPGVGCTCFFLNFSVAHMQVTQRLPGSLVRAVMLGEAAGCSKRIGILAAVRVGLVLMLHVQPVAAGSQLRMIGRH